MSEAIENPNWSDERYISQLESELTSLRAQLAKAKLHGEMWEFLDYGCDCAEIEYDNDQYNLMLWHDGEVRTTFHYAPTIYDAVKQAMEETSPK